MTRTSVSSGRVLVVAATILSVAIAPALAQSPCGLCNTTIVLNSELATCFLSDYDALAAKAGTAVVVDLSGCDTSSRGIAEALPMPVSPPSATALEPDLEFMVSREQLDCVKQKLEEPGLVLDPYLKIDLASCE